MFPVLHSVSPLLEMYSLLLKNTNSNPTHATGLVHTAEPSNNYKQLMHATRPSNDTLMCLCTHCSIPEINRTCL